MSKGVAFIERIVSEGTGEKRGATIGAWIGELTSLQSLFDQQMNVVVERHHRQ